MAESLLRHYFIGMVLFTIIVVSVVYTIDLLNNGTGSGDEVSGFMDQTELASFNSTFNIEQNVTASTNRLKDDLTNLQVNGITDIISLPLALIQSSWGLINYIITSFGFMNSAIVGLAGVLGIPTFIPTFLVFIIILFFVFSALSLFFGKDT